MLSMSRNQNWMLARTTHCTASNMYISATITLVRDFVPQSFICSDFVFALALNDL